jgi:hypothetical protein
MGLIPPPEKLTSEEFERRIAAGAKTIAEVDPSFANWVLSGPTGLFARIFKTYTYRRLHEHIFNKEKGENDEQTAR